MDALDAEDSLWVIDDGGGGMDEAGFEKLWLMVESTTSIE